MIPDGTPTARCSARRQAPASSSGSRSIGGVGQRDGHHDLERRRRRQARALRQVRPDLPRSPTGVAAERVELRRDRGDVASPPLGWCVAAVGSHVHPPAASRDRSSMRGPTELDLEGDRAVDRRTGRTSPSVWSVCSPIRFARPGAR
jgi:hypothetical protein